MAKSIKNIRLENQLIEKIQGMADCEYQGNFTAAMECLINQAISARSVDERVKWIMYSAAKQSIADEDLSEKDYHKFITKLTDALHI